MHYIVQTFCTPQLDSFVIIEITDQTSELEIMNIDRLEKLHLLMPHFITDCVVR